MSQPVGFLDLAILEGDVPVLNHAKGHLGENFLDRETRRLVLGDPSSPPAVGAPPLVFGASIGTLDVAAMPASWPVRRLWGSWRKPLA
jgi:hypothetical protein